MPFSRHLSHRTAFSLQGYIQFRSTAGVPWSNLPLIDDIAQYVRSALTTMCSHRGKWRHTHTQKEGKQQQQQQKTYFWPLGEIFEWTYIKYINTLLSFWFRLIVFIGYALVFCRNHISISVKGAFRSGRGKIFFWSKQLNHMNQSY